jgi:hypothetical protein
MRALFAGALFYVLNDVIAPRIFGYVSAEILTTLAFLLLCLIALCIVQAIRPLHFKSRTLMLAALILTIGFQGWYWLTLITDSTDMSGDFGGCVQEMSILDAAGLTVKSAPDPSQTAAYCEKGFVGVFRSRYQYIQMYSMSNKDRQMKALQLIETYHKANHTYPTVVLMYDRENWITNGSGGTRGPEKPIKTSVLR